MIDWATCTTDDLLQSIPPAEDDRWEFKSATLLEASSKNEFLKVLSKQVSAFANSGGGNLVFGLSDRKSVEPCEQTVGNQPMKDYLATMVEQSVEYPLRHFRIHRIPLTGDNTNSIFVIAVEDSPAAPHQAKSDKHYYYRIDGHTKPAPHFHVELLRQRETRAVLEILLVEYHVEKFLGTETGIVEILMVLHIRNVSFQSAASWGVLVEHTKQDDCWEIRTTGEHFDETRCFLGSPTPLLPQASTKLCIPLRGRAYDQSGALQAINKLWKSVGFSFRPVTQNHVGQPVRFGDWPDGIKTTVAMNEFERQISSVLPQD
ncbi:Divergent AAA domain protein [Rubripirellula tenax]|uniref:Divergent AAA domain protein n=1 Tax=Rubripirellula tenax TaxID=2528015 RepID=A0A5C6F0S7_9BACT|nr:ATP-binding protein [Rubripirellula tenax]TWU54902.1 Divergent AAA domain protein [Rubripirellula tenax]